MKLILSGEDIAEAIRVYLASKDLMREDATVVLVATKRPGKSKIIDVTAEVTYAEPSG